MQKKVLGLRGIETQRGFEDTDLHGGGVVLRQVRTGEEPYLFLRIGAECVWHLSYENSYTEGKQERLDKLLERYNRDTEVILRHHFESTMSDLEGGEFMHPPHKGMAEYFGQLDRYERALAAREKHFADKEAERTRKAQEEEQQRDAIRQEELTQAEYALLQGEYIHPDLYEGLLTRYGIKVHPRTIGYIRNKVSTVSRDSYRFFGKNNSDHIRKHTAELMNLMVKVWGGQRCNQCLYNADDVCVNCEVPEGV